jgi:hypothetical protein
VYGDDEIEFDANDLEYEKAGDVLYRLLKDLTQFEQQKKRHKRSGLSWGKMVGVELAANSKIRDVQDGLVLVEVAHNAHLQLLMMKRPQLLIKLRLAYPTLNIFDIKARVVDDFISVLKEEAVATREVKICEEQDPIFMALLDRIRNMK